MDRVLYGQSVVGHSTLWTQLSMDTVQYEHSTVWTQHFMDTALYGHSTLQTQHCKDTALYGHSIANNCKFKIVKEDLLYRSNTCSYIKPVVAYETCNYIRPVVT
jgi:hypothetical protein